MAKVRTLLQGFSLGSDQGSISFSGVFLIEGARRIVVDTGHAGRRHLLVHRLQEHGLTPQDIDWVVLTHAHWDHMQNLDLFPHAKVFIHPRERAYCANPHANDWATPRYTSLVLESFRLEEVKEGDEIIPGVRVLDVPGHSPGSIALLVEGEEGVVAVSGDALPNTWSLTSGLPRYVFASVDEARASIRKLLSCSSVFYPGHDRPFRVDGGQRVTYLEETRVRVFGWPVRGPNEVAPEVTYSSEASNQAHIFVDPAGP